MGIYIRYRKTGVKILCIYAVYQVEAVEIVFMWVQNRLIC